MYTIEVDFEVYKQLTVRRATEEVTYNDVIRESLGLAKSVEVAVAPTKDKEKQSSNDWIVKGIRFPIGTEFRAAYKGQVPSGRVERGSLVLSNGETLQFSICSRRIDYW